MGFPGLKRYARNPILKPRGSGWESKAVFNPTVLQLDDKIYLLYRAVGEDGVSRMGLAVSQDGYTIGERLSEPIYVPRANFERMGCEDPRVTRMDEHIYMCYTAFDGKMARVAFTQISVDDFLNREWNKWEYPKVISPSNIWDKNACLLDRKVKEKYVFFHRPLIGNHKDIFIDYVEDLEFKSDRRLGGYPCLKVRHEKWDSDRVGIAGPPIYTNYGWVLIYHAKSAFDGHYRLGSALLDKDDPAGVVSRLEDPILEPRERYEVEGAVNNVVFSCGQALVGDELLVYYGSADERIALATCEFEELLGELVENSGIRKKIRATLLASVYNLI